MTNYYQLGIDFIAIDREKQTVYMCRITSTEKSVAVSHSPGLIDMIESNENKKSVPEELFCEKFSGVVAEMHNTPYA